MNTSNISVKHHDHTVNISFQSEKAVVASSKEKPCCKEIKSKDHSIVQAPTSLDERVIQLLEKKFGFYSISKIIAANTGFEEIASKAQYYFDSNKLTSGFPVQEIYKLFIDKRQWQHELGLFIYEDEPGYSKNLLTAFLQLENILLNGELDFQKLENIHDLSIKSDPKDEQLKSDPTYTAYSSVNLFLHINCTERGFKEVSELTLDNEGITLNNLKQQYTDDSCRTATFGVFCHNKIRHYIKPRTDYRYSIFDAVASIEYNIPKNRVHIWKYCDTYNKQIKEIKANYPKYPEGCQYLIVKSIAEVCRNIQVTHPFTDGNARTMGCLLVFVLLIIEGISPAIIPNANVFDAYSIDEIVKIMIAGQEQFQTLRI